MTLAAAKLGEILVREGIISSQQMQEALLEQNKSGKKLGSVLVSKGYIKEYELIKVLERIYNLPSIDLQSFEIPASVIELVPKDVCLKYKVLPVSKSGQTLVVAFSDPSNIFVRDDLSFLTRSKIQVVVASESAIEAAIEKYYGSSFNMERFKKEVHEDQAGETQEEVEVQVIDAGGDQKDAPIIKIVNMILADAIKKNASDIHIEPYENRFRVRIRVDGILIETIEPPQQSAAAIVSRIKIMSKLDIAEKRRPQDGRLKVRTKKSDIDFRVSTLPTLWGEKVVLRILDKSNLQLDMRKLGFEDDDLKTFKDAISLPQGLVLITGPTGSGKTTTIYSALAELNQPDVNICSAEDPVEFNIDGINQVQMVPEIELNFAAALKSFLRQDPDIVMVGEIRDLETAEICFKAASTGHLVVSTLHTNDAPSTIVRLTDMGVPGYIVTSSVTLIVAQRLVGKICEQCKREADVDPQVLIDLGVDTEDIGTFTPMEGSGCHHCNGTGIRGRLAIYELMKITEPIKEAVLAGASTSEIRRVARKEGMRTLRRSGILKLKQGLTTIQEVLSASVKDT